MMFHLFTILFVLGSTFVSSAKNDCHLKQLDTCLEQVEKISNDPKSQELLKTKEGVKSICV